MKIIKFTNTKRWILIGISYILTATMCTPNPNCHKVIDIINNTDKTVYYNFGSNSKVNSSNMPALTGGSYIIKPHSKNSSIASHCKENDFNDTGKIYCFIFDEQVLLKNPWDSIQKNEMVLKKFSFTLKEMQDANWTITYP